MDNEQQVLMDNDTYKSSESFSDPEHCSVAHVALCTYREKLNQLLQLYSAETQVQRRKSSQKQIVQVPDNGSGFWDAMNHAVVGSGHF